MRDFFTKLQELVPMSPGHETFVSRLGLRMRFGLKSVNARVEKALLLEDTTADSPGEIKGAGVGHEADSAAETTEATVVGSLTDSSLSGGAFTASRCFDNAEVGRLLCVNAYGRPKNANAHATNIVCTRQTERNQPKIFQPLAVCTDFSGAQRVC